MVSRFPGFSRQKRGADVTINDISPDQVVLWQWKVVSLNATLLFTWGIMIFLVAGSFLITRHLSSGVRISRWQTLLEIVVAGIRDQIRDISHKDPGRYVALVGTLFLFISVIGVTFFPRAFFMCPDTVLPRALSDEVNCIIPAEKCI